MSDETRSLRMAVGVTSPTHRSLLIAVAVASFLTTLVSPTQAAVVARTSSERAKEIVDRVDRMLRGNSSIGTKSSAR